MFVQGHVYYRSIYTETESDEETDDDRVNVNILRNRSDIVVVFVENLEILFS